MGAAAMRTLSPYPHLACLPCFRPPSLLPQVVLSSDAELSEAVSLATRTGRDRLMVYATVAAAAPPLATTGKAAARLADTEQKENLGAANGERLPAARGSGATLAAQVSRLASHAVNGGSSGARDPATGVAVGAGAFFAALVVLGAGALAGGRR